jgi:histidinol-phosphate aminotransferase
VSRDPRPDPRLDLGPLTPHVPEVLRGTAAYHVPQPPRTVAKLDANELPFALPAELRAELGRALAEVALERYPDAAARRLRQILVRQLSLPGPAAPRTPLAPDQLVFGNGSDELIAMLCSAFSAPHGGRPASILAPSPSFVYYRLAAIARGVEPIEVPLTPRFELDEAAMVRAIEDRHPRVVFLALPNNPTGTLWRLGFAAELAARYPGTVIVSDEAYFAYSGATSMPVLADHPNLVVMRTLSKVGMAGLRVGYTVSTPAIAALLEKLRPPYNLSSLDQCAAEFLLERAGAWCAERAADVVAERSRLSAALAERGFEVFPSEANLLLIRTTHATALWQRLADVGVMVRLFDAGPLAGCLRVTVGTAAELLAAL